MEFHEQNNFIDSQADIFKNHTFQNTEEAKSIISKDIAAFLDKMHLTQQVIIENCNKAITKTNENFETLQKLLEAFLY